MRLRLTLHAIALMMVIYSSLRLLFLVFNWGSFALFSWDALLWSFLSGLRFDLSSVLMVNAPFLILLFLLPLRWLALLHTQRSLKIFFWGFNFPFICLNLIDMEYYKFTGSRLTIDVLFLKGEATQQIDQFLINYWYLSLMALGFSMALWLWFPRIHIKQPPYEKWMFSFFKKTTTGLVSCAALVFGVRGGFQPKPLQPLHAYALSKSSELSTLTLNTTFTALKTKPRTHLQSLTYLKTNDEALSELLPNELKLDVNHPAPQNVVILVLESFSTEFWGVANNGKGYTPFLDSLAKKGLFLKNNYANGRRSIDALPAILFGVPSMMITPLVKTNYYGNHWNGLGHIAKRAGRHVSFFHGAPRGTMYFDAIAAMAGLEDYYPLERYPNAEIDFDGHWGIYDEPFLQYSVQKISEHPQPFLSTIFTISTHQPYHVPKKYMDRFPKGTLDIHQSVGYVDFAVQRFFEEAEKQPWYQNTLFVITGDHTQMSASETYDTATGRFRVPLLFFHPTQKLPHVDPLRITQHVDILPSLLDYLGIHNENYPLFGHSIFNDERDGEAVFHLDGYHWLVQKDSILQFVESTQQSDLYDIHDVHFKNSITDKPLIKEALDRRLKAYLQYYTNSLNENTLYSWRKNLFLEPDKRVASPQNTSAQLLKKNKKAIN